ncbi:MAG: T9SS type A sorting domain-containing protein [bacterium]
MRLCRSLLVVVVSLIFSMSVHGQSWEELASLPNPTGFPVMASANGKIYLLSGTQGTLAKTFEYNPETNSWSEKATIPSGTIYASGVELDGKIYVMGGGQNNVKKNLHYIYDPLTDTVVEGDTLMTPRMYHNAAVSNGKIYLIGGQNGDGTTEWYFDEYTPETNSWVRKTQTPHNQAWYCGAVGIGTKFYRIAGGRWNAPTDYFDCYDTETDTWEVLDPFPITLHAPSAVNFQDKIIVMGGYNNEEKIDSIYTYYPTSGLWILSFSRLPVAMAYHKSAVIGNYIYVYFKPEGSQSGLLWRSKFGTTDIRENTTFEINIFPNPCTEQFLIDLPCIPNTEFGIEISDILGRTVLSQDKILNFGAKNIINLPNIKSGVYFINVNINGNKFTRTLLVN